MNDGRVQVRKLLLIRVVRVRNDGGFDVASRITRAR